MVPITEKQLKILLASRENVAIIKELRRAQPFLKGDFYYNRMKALQQEAESLKAQLTGKSELKVEYDVEQYIVSYR